MENMHFYLVHHAVKCTVVQKRGAEHKKERTGNYAHSHQRYRYCLCCCVGYWFAKRYMYCCCIRCVRDWKGERVHAVR